MDHTDHLAVSIKTRNKNLYEGAAESLTSANDAGEFDVLLEHVNFITLIKGKIVLDKGLKSEKTFEMDSGVLSVFRNKVDAYIGV